MVEPILGLNYITIKGKVEAGERIHPDEPLFENVTVLNLDSYKNMLNFLNDFYKSMTCGGILGTHIASRLPLSVFKEGRRLKLSEIASTSGSLSVVIPEQGERSILMYLYL